MGTLMLSSSSSSSQLMVFHRLLRPAPILSFSFLKRSLSLLPHRTTSLCPITINNSSSCVLRSRTFSNLPALVSSSQALLESTEDVEDKEIAKENGEVTAAPSLRVKEKKELPSLTVKEKKELPSLTVKEKKELASYAHSLGKKLKSQQVGKSGVTDSVIFALDETLEANELLKLKIHGTCPGGELDDVVKHLEEATGSVVVGQIGRTVILYRPSVTKLKAEEKKKQAQNAFMRKKQYAAKQSFESKEQVPRPYARGRRGSSRV